MHPQGFWKCSLYIQQALRAFGALFLDNPLGFWQKSLPHTQNAAIPRTCNPRSYHAITARLRAPVCKRMCGVIAMHGTFPTKIGTTHAHAPARAAAAPAASFLTYKPAPGARASNLRAHALQMCIAPLCRPWSLFKPVSNPSTQHGSSERARAAAFHLARLSAPASRQGLPRRVAAVLLRQNARKPKHADNAPCVVALRAA